MHESEETEEIKTFLLYPYLLQGEQALPNCKPISVGHPCDARYTAPLPHPTTLLVGMKKRTHRHVVPMRDNSPFLHYVVICPEAEILCRP